MNATLGSSLNRLGVAVGLIASLSAPAMAGGGGPDLQVTWNVNGLSGDGTLAGFGIGAGMYTYSSITIGDGYEINWSFLVTDNGATGGFEILASTMGVTNTSDSDSTFGLDIILPVDIGAGSAFYGGSLGGSISGVEYGGYLATVDDDTPMWTAMVDGELLASLGMAPFELTSGAYLSADLEGQSFGDPIPSLEFAAAQESMSLHLDFILGSGTTFAITSNYVAQVPAPAGLALLGVAGLARRRRRD
jgi:MYXO-CTERM domain-containing protein